MRNTIKNWNGDKIPSSKMPSMTVIRENNISTDDIKFILEARSLKRTARRRNKRLLNLIFTLIGIAGFCIGAFYPAYLMDHPELTSAYVPGRGMLYQIAKVEIAAAILVAIPFARIKILAVIKNRKDRKKNKARHQKTRRSILERASQTI